MSLETHTFYMHYWLPSIWTKFGAEKNFASQMTESLFLALPISY